MKKIFLAILIFQGISSCKSTSNLESKGIQKESPIISPDTLSFTISEGNNLVFQAILNNKDSLDFYFDTGGTDLVIKQSVIDDKGYSVLEDIYSFSLGNIHWDELTIFPTRVGPKEAVGHFGWNLFKDKVVELDYENNWMIVHSSLPANLENHTKLKIKYTHTLFCIKGNVQVGEKGYSNRFLFDTGFQRAVILDKHLRQKSNFPDDLPVIKESKLRNGAGTEFVNRVVLVDELCLGTSCASQVPVQLLSTPNPARFKTHILGNELLKRFNTILDFQKGYAYLKSNSLLDLPYVDAS